MARPDVTPSTLLLKTNSGDGTTATVSIFKAPAAAIVSATVGFAGGRVGLRQIVVSIQYRRPLTEAEIEELPDRLPSIRENAIRAGVLDYEEVGRVAGNDSIAAQLAQKVDFLLDVAAPAQNASDLETSSFTIVGSGWDTVVVPIQIINGTGTIASTALPARVDVLLAPGETATQDVIIASAPSSASLIARLDLPSSMISLLETTVSGDVKKKYTPDELAQLPPEMLAKAHANGNEYVVQEVIAKADAGQPLSVLKGQLVTCTIQFTAPSVHFPDLTTGTLLIDAPSWAPTAVPLSAVIAQISATLSSDATVAPLRSGGAVNLQLTSGAGADTPLGDPVSMLVHRRA